MKIQKNILAFQFQFKKEHENNKTITYKIKSIDTGRFMPSKLSDLADNLSEINNKDAKHAWRERRSEQNVTLLGLKITDAKNAMEH